MRNPYRVIIWGPGGLGSVLIWEVIQSPALELVGVRCYSDSKNGIDAGTLIGADRVGIAASNDVEALLKIQCDCIIYTARDMGGYNTDDEILMLLSRGMNVVTPLPYHNAHLFRDQAFGEKLEAACRRGNSVFHATGIDPDVISDRVLLGLTSMCTEIKYLKLQENWECDAVEPELLAIAGFGHPMDDAKQASVAAAIAENFLKAIGYTVEKMLGVKYVRVDETHNYFPAPHDIQSRNALIKKGTVARVMHRFSGYTADSELQPFFTMEVNWIVGHEMLPEGVLPNQYWIATIEGRPSMKMVIDLRTSTENDERFYQIGNMKTEPGYHGTVAPCLQAIPHICAAKAGVLPSFGPGLHWMRDLRDSVPNVH